MSMLTLKIYPDRLYVYQQDNLIVRGTIDLMTGIRISKIRITPKHFLFSVKKPGTKKCSCVFYPFPKTPHPPFQGPGLGAYSSRNSKKYTKPAILILDELGYLPINKTGADLLFQVISLRYERGSLIITSNRAFKNWPEIFNKEKAFPIRRKGLSLTGLTDYLGSQNPYGCTGLT